MIGPANESAGSSPPTRPASSASSRDAAGMPPTSVSYRPSTVRPTLMPSAIAAVRSISPAAMRTRASAVPMESPVSPGSRMPAAHVATAWSWPAIATGMPAGRPSERAAA
ncbi:hypothetical protein [Pseudolysinimonas kribbensis]|uniref:hypothetical protein n=1 Tax=Pseudolysinimonas kribbensis TaxID=433641 RepID=UPI0024E143CD|nr:hypothetical protein [Pseudolysinimonas kribbensis]